MCHCDITGVNKMKKSITLSLIIVLTTGIMPTCFAQGFWRNVGNALLGAAVGYTENLIGSTLTREEDRKSWESITKDINDGLNLNDNNVNVGNKLQEGKIEEAVIDMGVNAANESGNRTLISVSNTVKTQHEYKENVQSGMDQKEAQNIAAEQISNIILDDIEERERIADEKKRQERNLENEEISSFNYYSQEQQATNKQETTTQQVQVSSDEELYNETSGYKEDYSTANEIQESTQQEQASSNEELNNEVSGYEEEHSTANEIQESTQQEQVSSDEELYNETSGYKEDYSTANEIQETSTQQEQMSREMELKKKLSDAFGHKKENSTITKEETKEETTAQQEPISKDASSKKKISDFFGHKVENSTVNKQESTTQQDQVSKNVEIKKKLSDAFGHKKTAQ
jgi:hypothetical protein